MSRLSDIRRVSAEEELTLSQLIAQDPFRARRPFDQGGRTPLGIRPGMRGLKTGDVDGLAPYMAGDDIRMIDWRGFARTGQLRIKEREREAHSAVMLIADLGPHMRFGTRDGSLALRAARALATQAWIALRRDEPVGIATVPHGVLSAPVRGRRRLMHGLEALAESFNTAATAPTRLDAVIEAAAEHLKSADELWIFADFHHWSRSGNLPAANPLRSGRWYAVQVDDAVHSSPPPVGHYPGESLSERQEAEDLYVAAALPGQHAEAVSAASGRLSRELEALGWRIAGHQKMPDRHWSHDS